MVRYNSGFGHQQALTDAVFERGDGDFVWDTTGKRYLDFFMNESLPFGHNKNILASALNESFPINVGLYDNAKRADTLSLLASIFPEYGNFQFNTSGTLANEAAMRYAVAITGRSSFLGFSGSYHGRARATASLSDMDVSNGIRIPGFGRLPFPGYDPLTRGSLEADATVDVSQNLASAAAIIDSLGPETVAGVMLEPILAKSVLRPPDGWLRRLQDEVLRPRGILLLVDECFTSGRVGVWSAGVSHGAEPDVITFSKSFSAGYPFAGVACREEHVSATNRVKGGDAASAQALQCLVVSSTLRRLIQLDVNEHSRIIGELFLELGSNWNRATSVRRVVAEGALLGVEFTRKDRALAVARECVQRGLLLAAVNRTVRLTPSLILDRELLTEATAIIDSVLEDGYGD